MSENITRKVDLDIEVDCWKCGAKLTFTTDVDAYGDLSVHADPCKNCVEEAVEKVKEEVDQ